MPGTGLECGAKAFEEEARRDDEEAAACHLRHNQGGAQTAHRLGWASGLAVECCSGIIVSNIEQWRKTAYDRDANARGAGRSDAEEIRSKHKTLGILVEEKRRDNTHGPRGQQHSERATGDGDDDAVREQLCDEPAAGGAERDPNRYLVRAHRGTCEQE